MKRETVIRGLLVLVLGLPVAAVAGPSGQGGSSGQGGKDAPVPKVMRNAFAGAQTESFPLSPGQIHRFLHRKDRTEQAIHNGNPPSLVSRSRTISMRAGSSAPTLHLYPGYVTTVIFLDSTGSPWPITSVTVGDPKHFSVNKPKGLKPGNLLTISTPSRYATSNMVVTLKGSDTPIVVQITTRAANDKPGQKADTMVEFRADRPGPKAKKPSVGPSPAASPSNAELSFLDNVPPDGAKPVHLKPSIQGVSAWNYKKRLYLRSQYPAAWPAWTSVSRGPGGVRLYVMPQVDSLILMKDGNNVSLTVGDTSGGSNG